MRVWDWTGILVSGRPWVFSEREEPRSVPGYSAEGMAWEPGEGWRLWTPLGGA